MRRRRHRHEAEEEAGINLTPMLDIVFIMLIFFIVTTSFVKEAGVEVNRPTADTAQRKERGNIIIAIRPNGEVWVDQRPVDVRAVRAHVARLHSQNPQGGVVIAADQQAQTGVLVKVMDQVRMAGVADIAIAAQEGGG